MVFTLGRRHTFLFGNEALALVQIPCRHLAVRTLLAPDNMLRPDFRHTSEAG